MTSGNQKIAKEKEETMEDWKETEHQKEETTMINLMAEDCPQTPKSLYEEVK